MGVGISIGIEDAGGLEEQASLDFKLTDVTNRYRVVVMTSTMLLMLVTDTDDAGDAGDANADFFVLLFVYSALKTLKWN